MVDKQKFAAQEEALGIRVTFVGRHFVITDHLKDYVYEKLSKIERFHNHMLDFHITMEVIRQEHKVDFLLKLEHFHVKVSASTTDMYASIDKAMERLHEKIRRWKTRMQDHHQKAKSAIAMQVDVLHRPFSNLDAINDAIDEENRKREAQEYLPPRVIGSESRPLKQLTVEEAVMKMELSDDSFMLFRGEEDLKLKLIYRREDGCYGLIFVE